MEPTSSTIAAIAATISAVIVSLLGVDSYSVMYSAAGAYLAVLNSKDDKVSRRKIFVTVALTTVIGAALGNAAFELLSLKVKSALFVTCITGGYGCQAILTALVDKGKGLIGAATPKDGDKP